MKKRTLQLPLRGFVVLVVVATAVGMRGWAASKAPQVASQAGQVSIASWIWHDEGKPLQSAPAGSRYFRKMFELSRPEKVVLDITCDDAYEVYVNGDLVGSGDNVRSVRAFDITRRANVGKNVLAVKATNLKGPAGLLVRCLVTQRGGTQVSIRSDASWRSSVQEQPGWNTLGFEDQPWSTVKVLGGYGQVVLWRDLRWESGVGGRFQVPEGFVVEQVASAELTGSVVNMTFDEKGRILFSREGQAVYLLKDNDANGVADEAQKYVDQVRNCQGLLALDGDLYAVGDGPDETGLYRLSDTNNDGVAEVVETVGTTRGGMGEHGPHAILLGPDGWLYWVMGNHAQIAAEAEPNSPLNRFYEGDLPRPRYEDAGGHAVGIKAPGGTIIRLSRQAKNRKWYRVAGGFRNQFDAGFNLLGEIFTFDSDMEWDVGLPWYRPVRVNHAAPGAEFGWRSGFAKWPTYYFDSLPAAADLGRGSPTGVVFYQHHVFPRAYHDAFFVSDWSQGKIIAVPLKRDGATWKGTPEEFATGNPLNVTDVEVGPDGALYFSCGGRGTEGGVFRIVHRGGGIERSRRSDPVEMALVQPQPLAAWARPTLKALRDEAGDRWEASLTQIASDARRAAAERVRALDLLQTYGPAPSEALLLLLLRDGAAEVRAHAVYLLGVHPSRAAQCELPGLRSDPDPLVRRRLCEALVRGGMGAEPRQLLPLLADSDRWVRFAARRALQDSPTFLWANDVFASDDIRFCTSGLLVLLALKPDDAMLQRIIARQSQLLSGSYADDELLDLLRTVQLSLLQADQGKEGTVPEIREQLLKRFSADDWRLNRELARTLAFLQEPKAVPRLLEQLAQQASRPEQIHLAVCARYVPHGWDTRGKRQLLAWFDQAMGWEGGHSFSLYMENVTRDFLPVLTQQERAALVEDGSSFLMPARLLVTSLRSEQASGMILALVTLDARLSQSTEGLASDRRALAEAVVAALGRAGTPAALKFLREIFETDPDRRPAISRALAAHPVAENWDALVASLDFVSGETLRACLNAVGQIDRKPENPAVLRSVVVAGLKLGDAGRKPAAELLAKWMGPEVADPNAAGALEQWQKWLAQTHPELPPATLPKTTAPSRWQYDQLLAFVTENPDGLSGAAERGAAVFEQAQCLKCHRFGARGEGIGPDLTTVRRRFQRKDILEAIFYPSQIISDQYRSTTVVTTAGKVLTGLVAPQGSDAIVLLDSEGTKTVIAKQQIDEQAPANVSSMPEGLLNTLSLQQIADLFAHLEQIPDGQTGGP